MRRTTMRRTTMRRRSHHVATVVVAAVMVHSCFLSSRNSPGSVLAMKTVKECTYPDWQCSPDPAAAVTYYVNALSGNDQNDGKRDNRAWQTIGRALEVIAAHPNDCLEFRLGPGQYGGLDLAPDAENLIPAGTFPRTSPHAWIIFTAEHLASMSYVRIHDMGSAKIVLRGVIINDVGVTDADEEMGGHKGGVVSIVNSSQVRLANCLLDFASSIEPEPFQQRSFSFDESAGVVMAGEPEDMDANDTQLEGSLGMLHCSNATDVVVQSTTISGGVTGVLFSMGQDLHLWDSDVGMQFGGNAALRIVDSRGVTVEANNFHNVRPSKDPTTTTSDADSTTEQRRLSMATREGDRGQLQDQRREEETDGNNESSKKDMHMDAIQIVSKTMGGADRTEGEAAEYVNQVAIRDNIFVEIAGSCITTRGDNATGYIKGLEISGNVFEPYPLGAIDNDLAADKMDLRGVSDFLMEYNSVAAGTVRLQDTTGYVNENLLHTLNVADHAIVKESDSGGKSDFNMLQSLVVDETSSVALGGNSDIFLITFRGSGLDPTTIEACTGASDGLHVGSVPCDPCHWQESDPDRNPGEPLKPVALFAIQPRKIYFGRVLTLNPRASVACGDVTGVDYNYISKVQWTIRDMNGVSQQAFTTSLKKNERMNPVYTTLLQEGMFTVTLQVTDSRNVTSAPLTREVEAMGKPRRRLGGTGAGVVEEEQQSLRRMLWSTLQGIRGHERDLCIWHGSEKPDDDEEKDEEERILYLHEQFRVRPSLQH